MLDCLTCGKRLYNTNDIRIHKSRRCTPSSNPQTVDDYSPSITTLIGAGTLTFDTPTYDPTPDPSPSFGGFDDGDSGGAGASSDW